jgi:hypothetical protein
MLHHGTDDPMVIILNNQDLIAIYHPSGEKLLCNQDVPDIERKPDPN